MVHTDKHLKQKKMRKIKFRAWHKEQGKMYSAEEMGQGQLTLMPDGRGFANIHSVSKRLSEIDDNQKMIALQFTGLHDKNGKEIYEGDLLCYHDSDEEPEIGLVFFNEGIWQLGPKDYIMGLSEFDIFKIIGNIYENPELINQPAKPTG